MVKPYPCFKVKIIKSNQIKSNKSLLFINIRQYKNENLSSTHWLVKQRQEQQQRQLYLISVHTLSAPLRSLCVSYSNFTLPPTPTPTHKHVKHYLCSACLVVETIQRELFPLPRHCDLTSRSMSRSSKWAWVYICYAKVYCHARFECHSLNIVRDRTNKLQVKPLSSLRCSCDLKWRSRSSDWETST